MPAAEVKLVLIIVFIIVVGTYVFRQDIRKNTIVFLLGCFSGFVVQFPLGPHINLYTPNISLYVTYVSVAVILAWGMALVAIYAVHLWLCRIFRMRPGLAVFLFSALPVILIVEYIGSNIIVMKLHDYTRFKPLMPHLNSMHAPPWLYGYYLLCACAFYFMLKRLRIHTEDWRAVPIRIASPEPQERSGGMLP
jgi:hypothetical protein